MGVSSTTNRVVYSGNGMATSFSFPYYFFNLSDLNVYLYDTVAGGSVLQTLGTNYSVSGTANYQGIYTSGASVVFSVAPISTAEVVIVRNPPEVQNFNILENGIIPSQTLVQQLDYLTLLVQRLQDEVSRSVTLSDGMAPGFSTALPSNMAFEPLAYLQVNSAGTGFQVVNTVAWQSVTIPYTSVQSASMSQSVAAFSLPATGIIRGLVIKHSSSFQGAGITDVYVQVGVSGTPGEFFPDFDVAQSVSDSAFDNLSMGFISSFANATQIYMNFVSTGANLSNLTQGSVTLYYKYETV